MQQESRMLPMQNPVSIAHPRLAGPMSWADDCPDQALPKQQRVLKVSKGSTVTAGFPQRAAESAAVSDLSSCNEAWMMDTADINVHLNCTLCPRTASETAGIGSRRTQTKRTCSLRAWSLSNRRNTFPCLHLKIPQTDPLSAALH
jgi:hypothetical protein